MALWANRLKSEVKLDCRMYGAYTRLQGFVSVGGHVVCRVLSQSLFNSLTH